MANKKICREFKNTSGGTVKDLRLEVEPVCEILDAGGFRNISPYGEASRVFELGNVIGDIPNNGSVTVCFKLPSNKDLIITPKWTTTDGEAENCEDVAVLAAVLPEDAKKAVRMAFSAIFDSTDD